MEVRILLASSKTQGQQKKLRNQMKVGMTAAKLDEVNKIQLRHEEHDKWKDGCQVFDFKIFYSLF